jgi:hypothetical protein
MDFLLQDLWNNIFLKTCGCKSQAYCKKVRRSEQFVERKKRKTTIKEKSKIV